MMDRLLDSIGRLYGLTPRDVGEFATLKANGMTFAVRAFDAEGLGHVSVMEAKGFFGLMKMDTLMIVPKKKDLPLYSYDRIYAMGNDTLIAELYDTMIAPADLSALDGIKQRFAALPERDAGAHWYDSIKLGQSLSKKGKKALSSSFDEFAALHLEAYLNAPAAAVSDLEEKNARTAAYVNGLLTHGGPSTDVFEKSLGIETTEELFRRVLFGIDGELIFRNR